MLLRDHQDIETAMLLIEETGGQIIKEITQIEGSTTVVIIQIEDTMAVVAQATILPGQTHVLVTRTTDHPIQQADHHQDRIQCH